MKTHALAAALGAALAGNASAAPLKVPKVEGGMVGVDPYVQEFQTAMEQANAELASIQSAIEAVQVPQGTKAGALAAGVKAAADYGAVGAVVLRAEQAHAKFLAHIMGFKSASDLDAKLDLKSPAFEVVRDADLRPKADRILKGSAGAARFAAAGGASAPKFAAAAAPTGFGSAGGPVGAGFESSLSPSAPQAAALGHTNTGGGGLSEGAGDPSAGVATAAHDAAPSVGPAAAALSSNQSNVAELAFKRARERQSAAESAAKERQQQKDQQDQQLAQMAMQMLAQAGQALKKTEKKSGECKNCNKGKQDQAADAAAAAPS